jgi:hypothetical protein
MLVEFIDHSAEFVVPELDGSVVEGGQNPRSFRMEREAFYTRRLLLIGWDYFCLELCEHFLLNTQQITDTWETLILGQLIDETSALILHRDHKLSQLLTSDL